MTGTAGTSPGAPRLSVAQEALSYVSVLLGWYSGQHDAYAAGADASSRRLRTRA
ncbi:MAG: hypothetical protein QOJ29_1046 [Thermoleophilaceae bacterium]|nr:hypothetical protein [Thermoleophilaceae bacterium]